jgi:hypothetical protein
LASSSIACLPRITSPAPSFTATAFSSFATASGCSSASVSMRIARSAPIAIAVRSVSWHAAVPADTAITSVALPASFSLSASSTAISSKGFIDILTLASSTPDWSAFTRTFTLKSTTRFTGTRIFMGVKWDKDSNARLNYSPPAGTCVAPRCLLDMNAPDLHLIGAVREGSPHPRGATWDGKGVNFALFSAHATRVEVCLFDHAGHETARIPLPEYRDETWHGYVPGIGPGQYYGYRVHGPYEPDGGTPVQPRTSWSSTPTRAPISAS